MWTFVAFFLFFSIPAIFAEEASHIVEVASTEDAASKHQANIWHHSSELYANQATAIRYASGATELPQSQFQAFTVKDLQQMPLQLLGNGSIEYCEGHPMISVQIKRLTQKIDHALAYYRLEEAKNLVETAKGALLCLQDVLDPDVVARLYYLEGLIQYYNGNTEATSIAYRNAIRFQPNMKWDSIFPPDSKELFDAAHEHFNSLKEIPLEIYPKSAQKDVWINGIPINPQGHLSVPYGANFIQIVSVDIESAYIMLDDLQSSAVLIVTSAITDDMISWVDNPEKIDELNAITSLFSQEEDPFFLYRNGEIWQQKADHSWIQLTVPPLAKVFGLNSKKKLGQSLYYAGLTLSSGAFLYTIDQGNRAVTAYNIGNNPEITTTWDAFATQEQIFLDAKHNYKMGWGLTATGVVFTGLGYWLKE